MTDAMTEHLPLHHTEAIHIREDLQRLRIYASTQLLFDVCVQEEGLRQAPELDADCSVKIPPAIGLRGICRHEPEPQTSEVHKERLAVESFDLMRHVVDVIV